VDDLGRLVEERLSYAQSGARMWSVAYHGSAAVAILCSGTVTFLAAVERQGMSQPVLAAILSAIATVSITLSTTLGFPRKWRANRASRTALQLLKVDLTAEDADIATLRERYKEILKTHDRAIGGE
jgi:hypothetical protein